MKTPLLVRLFAFFFAILAMPLIAYAQISEIVRENITYQLSEEDGSCEVVSVPATYEGEVKIPQIILLAQTYTVTRIGREAFKVDIDIPGYSNVTKVYLPLTIEEIGAGAFAYLNKVTEIEIPENVKFIDYKGFSELKNLINLYCYAAIPPALGEDVFKKSNLKNATLYVPESSVELYKRQKQWKDFKRIVAINNHPGYAVEENERLLALARAEAEKAEQERIRAEQEAEQERRKIQEDSIAAEKGDMNAIIRLAERYKTGNGLTRDAEKAFTLYQKAANLGDTNSMYELGSAYYNGSGTTKDIDTALVWLNKAAEGGNNNALMRIRAIQRENGLFWDSADKWKVNFSNFTLEPLGKNKNGLFGTLVNDYRIGHYIITSSDNLLSTRETFDSFINKKSKLKISKPSSFFIQGTESFDSDSSVDTALSELFDLIDHTGLNKVDVKSARQSLWHEFTEYTYMGSYNLKTKKYTSLKEETAAKFSRRFGANPLEMTNGEILKVGRSFSLLSEYFNWANQHFPYYLLRLSIDHGTSKCYDIVNSLNNKSVGYFWVRSGTVSSVTWY